MWKELVNGLLALYIVIAGLLAPISLWIVGAAVIVFVLSFWAAIERPAHEDRPIVHAH